MALEQGGPPADIPPIPLPAGRSRNTPFGELLIMNVTFDDPKEVDAILDPEGHAEFFDPPTPPRPGWPSRRDVLGIT